MVEWIEQYLSRRLEEHNQELALLEKRLEEYTGLKSEKQVKIEESYYRFAKRLKLIGFEHWKPKTPAPRHPVVFINGEIIDLRKIIIPEATRDWDFSTTNWILDTSIYVSSPSSFKALEELDMLCKYTGTTNLPQGRLVTWWMTNFTAGITFYFRCQTPVGSASVDETYWVFLDQINAIVDAGRTTEPRYAERKSSLIGGWDINKWWLNRVTWWSDPNIGLIIRVERMMRDTWQKECEDFIDENDVWKDSTINRVGFYLSASDVDGQYTWIDDTEIWAP